MTELLEQGLLKLGLTLSDKQLNQFIQYYKLLIEKNKVMNLTAITEYSEVVHKHFLDSLSIVLSPIFQGEGSVIDVGTGAGFPGIPLKIAFPDLEVTLLDSLNKRVNFLIEVADKLGLEKIECIHGRAEDIGREEIYREKFDFCVSRAVAALPVLAEYGMPFVKKGGYFIPYKSIKIEEELKEATRAVKLLSGEIKDIVSFTIPNTEIERTLIVIKKTAPIAKTYPRKAGIPKKEPLK